jgi:putative transposase
MPRPFQVINVGKDKGLQATALASAPRTRRSRKEYRGGAHSVFEIHLHLVWTTKYRKPVLTGEVALRWREWIREVGGQPEVKIRKGQGSKEHVPLFVSIPPQVTISRLVQWLKGKSANRMMSEFVHRRKVFGGRHLWARGYFCCRAGNVTEEVIAEYIANQNTEVDEDFQVDGYGRLQEASST